MRGTEISPTLAIPRQRLLSILAILVLGAACSNTTPQASSASSAQSEPSGIHSAVFVDMTYAADEAELVRSSTLVVIGSPVGDVEVDLLGDGRFADYYQTIRIESVIGSDVSLDSVRIVWLGVSPSLFDANIETDSKPLNEILRPGDRYVFFLQTSGAKGLYVPVGHSQGILQFDPGGLTRTLGAHGFSSLVGLDLAGLALAVQEVKP